MIFIVFMTYLCCETFKTNHYDKNNFFYSDVPDIRLSNVVKKGKRTPKFRIVLMKVQQIIKIVNLPGTSELLNMI